MGKRLRTQNTILLVEDFRPVRAIITSLLDGNPDLRVIGEASDGVEAVAKAQELRPDVVLMDIGLPKLNGLEAARRIRELVPSSKIVFLTQEASAEVLKEALSLGSWGYIVKLQTGIDLLNGLTSILQGKRFVSEGADGNGLASTKAPKLSWLA